MLSARNQILGTVQAVKSDAAECAVKIAFNRYVATAVITAEAAEENDIKPGCEVAIVVKAPHVMFANTGKPIQGLSARNQFDGVVSDITHGAVNARLSVKLDGGATITGSITEQALEELGFDVDKPALVIIKATDVLVSVL